MIGCVIELLDSNNNILFQTPTISDASSNPYYRFDGPGIDDSSKSTDESTTEIIEKTNITKWNIYDHPGKEICSTDFDSVSSCTYGPPHLKVTALSHNVATHFELSWTITNDGGSMTNDQKVIAQLFIHNSDDTWDRATSVNLPTSYFLSNETPTTATTTDHQGTYIEGTTKPVGLLTYSGMVAGATSTVKLTFVEQLPDGHYAVVVNVYDPDGPITDIAPRPIHDAPIDTLLQWGGQGQQFALLQPKIMSGKLYHYYWNVNYTYNHDAMTETPGPYRPGPRQSSDSLQAGRQQYLTITLAADAAAAALLARAEAVETFLPSGVSASQATLKQVITAEAAAAAATPILRFAAVGGNFSAPADYHDNYLPWVSRASSQHEDNKWQGGTSNESESHYGKLMTPNVDAPWKYPNDLDLGDTAGASSNDAIVGYSNTQGWHNTEVWIEYENVGDTGNCVINATKESENGYDWGDILHLNSDGYYIATLWNGENVNTNNASFAHQFTLATNERVRFKYRKDSSYNRGKDRMWFSIHMGTPP